MADELPRLDGPSQRWSHDWHPYDDYLTIHHSYMQALVNEGLILHDALSFIESRDGRGRLQQVNVTGRITCRSGVVIMVDKWFGVRRQRGKEEVRGYSYSYQSWRLPVEGQLIRYDSAHGMNELHRHLYDARTGEEITEEPVALEDLPTLGQFIRDVVEYAERAGG